MCLIRLHYRLLWAAVLMQSILFLIFMRTDIALGRNLECSLVINAVSCCLGLGLMLGLNGIRPQATSYKFCICAECKEQRKLGVERYQ